MCSTPPIKLLFALGIVPPGYALLETIGRKTGKTRRTPVGDGRLGKQFWLVAEHGMSLLFFRSGNVNATKESEDLGCPSFFAVKVDFCSVVRSARIAWAELPIRLQAFLNVPLL